MIRTVFPTPAPPNRPILPPFAYGQIRSTTLIPVSRISVAGICSSSEGAGRWIDQRSFASGAGLLSTGSPRRLNTRPRQASPTGTVIGPPVSTAFVPRTRPSVEFMAIHLTTSSPICCATSAVSFAPFDSISMALRRAGSSSCAKRISRTGPMTCTTSPMCFSLMF